MPGTHAIFAPSKSDVWGHCAGALALGKGIVDPPSEPAASGTLTHRIAENALRGITGEYAVGSMHTVDGFTFTVDDDRVARARAYADAILRRGGVQFYEVALDMHLWMGIWGQFGTSDAVICHLDTATLEVHDLKDGYNRVDAAGNSQLLCYAGAALYKFAYLCEWRHIEVFIHQPRLDWADSKKYTRKELLHELGELATAAQRANRVLEQREPPSYKTGAWCKWCPARGRCPQQAAEVAAMLPDVSATGAALTDAELGDLLKKEAEITGAFAAWRAEALMRARAGARIPGWKLAQGRMGNRAWSDALAAETALNAALAGDAYTRKLISPTEAEKKLKKQPEVWAALQPNIVRKEGEPTLVPEADGRAALPANPVEFDTIPTGIDLLG